MIYNDICIKNS